MRPRVLLVSPSFHEYWRSIRRGLEANGLDVVPFVYDEHATVVDKVRHQVLHELPTRLHLDHGRRALARRATDGAIAALRASRADGIIVIRGDVFLDDLWATIDDLDLPSVLWLYDEVRRTTHPVERLRRFSLVATYSKRDRADLQARDVDARYLANAFDPAMEPAVRSTPAVVFVGARYAGRERTLVALQRHGVPVRAYGRDWSHHPFDRARTWQWHRPAVPASRDVARIEAYGLFAGAAATLNLHEDQDGFTMRTFEACGVGGLQLIDRTDVDDLYDPGHEIIPFTSQTELEELCRRALDDPAWAKQVGMAARRRTLAHHTFERRTKELAELWA